MRNSSRLYEDDVNEGEILIWPGWLGWLPHGTTAIADGSLSVNGRLHPKTTGVQIIPCRCLWTSCAGTVSVHYTLYTIQGIMTCVAAASTDGPRQRKETYCGYIASIGVWNPACD
jgi:hypothetical protein